MKDPVFDSARFMAVWGRVSSQQGKAALKKPDAALKIPQKRKSMAVRFIPQI